jgi:hypothetical protein
VKVQLTAGPLALVKGTLSTPRLESLSILTHVSDPNIQLAAIWEERTDALDPMALDLETRGTDPLDPNSAIVGVGLSDSRGSVYIDLTTSDPDTLGMLMTALEGHGVPLIAHNLPFDASFVYANAGWYTNWKYCTYALYKLLATEGWPGQTWGLKDAQRQLLGWTETNELELDCWLIENGYVADTKKEETAGHYWVEEKERWIKPKKEEMWRAPAEILGKYCALDADSTYQLFTKVLLPAIRSTSGGRYHLEDNEVGYYSRIYQRYIQILIAQRFLGISVDSGRLREYNAKLIQEISAKESEFLNHPEVAPHAEAYRDSILGDHWKSEPAKYKKEKARPKEPEKLNKKGEVSGKWHAWKTRIDNWPTPEVSQRWLDWKTKEARLLEETKLNINSGQQKQWLFYERLGYKPKLFTESGQPAVDAKALQGFGAPGKVLIEQNEATKEQGYVQGVLDALRDGVLHANVRTPGTLTGRLAGSGGVNVQQMPKSQGFLETWVARPGYSLVEFDFTALEQVVLAELSRDKALWKLYGPGARPNDAYLFTGAYLPVIGKAIRAAGYDPDAPTIEGIQKAKKEAKSARQIAKVVALASAYGAGANKIAQTLRLSGIDITDQQAKEIHSGYWELYSGVKEYERELVRQWEQNRGWIYNGIGRPISIADMYLKDIVNRQCQSTGHDLLVYFVVLVADKLDAAGIEWTPWIADWHDEFIFEIRDEHVATAVQLIDGPILNEFNSRLSGKIPLKGNAEVARNLAEIKCKG